MVLEVRGVYQPIQAEVNFVLDLFTVLSFVQACLLKIKLELLIELN